MSLKGTAFLAMWHDVEAGHEAEYQLWHTREHMPERMSLPGFLRGRRGVARHLPHQQFLTIYEAETLEAFRSAAYLDRLNNPSPWSAEIAAHFRNFLRVSCETVSTVGAGVGGAVVTTRADLSETMDERAAVRAFPALSDRLMAMPAICAVHVGLARPEYSGLQTTEVALRPRMREPSFDLAIIVEASGGCELEALPDAIAEAVRSSGFSNIRTDVYQTAFVLGPDGGS